MTTALKTGPVLKIGASLTMVLALLGTVPAAQAAPMQPAAIQNAAGAMPAATPVDWGPGGPGWRRGPPPGGGWHSGGPGWHGGGPGWRGGPPPRYGYGWGPRRNYGWYGAGTGLAAGLALGAIAAQPYYRSSCGYVMVPTWRYGHRVYVQRYRCW
ncbi:hypothetical protein MWN34_16120 [Ancylobacter sp. 6x-1]|uniref:BA14K family protein n=1 Tax=Ancylobacter crimeensis TaxID=2579147 RepID=A0ABT0DER3_9HYPH|nr:hypothetical protein [Ancylobacter crimeensis]MCK0198440.1 hypothetical protein [Ancylobacter crimeensis]